MSNAVHPLVEQAIRLAEQARGLPVDEAALVCEQAFTILQAAQAEVLIDGERAGELADSGCRTVASFARTVLRRSDGEASKIAGVARHLVDFPKLAQAYAAGLAHTANLRVVVEYVPKCGLDVLQAHEVQLVNVATTGGPQQVHALCQRILEVNHPDHDQHKATAAGLRMVRIRRVGDLAHVDAMIEPDIADRLKATVAAMAQAARNPTDPQPYAERQADAFEHVLAKGMDAATTSISGSSARARARTQAVVQVQLETLLGMPEHGQAWLARFGLIPTRLAQRLCCDAVVRMVVKHGDLVLNVGDSVRTVTDRQHTALSTIHPTCVLPGCAIPFADCTIHHLWWHSQGGPTDLALQVPLCGAHHRWLHDGGISITRDDGALVFRDRLGRIIANTTETLAAQLHLLHTDHGHTGPTAGPCDQCHPLATEILTQVGGWPDTEYRHGTWGWNGPHPSPPPGHAPPEAS